MLFAGGALGLLTVSIERPMPVGDDMPVMVAVAAAFALGGVLTVRPKLLPLRATPWLVAFATVLTTLVVRAAGIDDDHGADYDVLYLMVVLYSFYFLSTRVAVTELCLVAIAYAAILLEKASFGVAITHWVVTLGTLSVVGVLVGHLNRRVDGLISELDEGARHDPLTGALNRRGLEERMGIEIARARRTGEPLCTLTVDLDGLKEVNDSHGHAAGDEALALAAEVMASGLRDMDVLSRVGGDEFMVLLPGCGSEAGMKIAEELVEMMQERSSTEAWPATLSVGVAAAPPLPLDPEPLSVAADRALYRAKTLGRNRAAVDGHDEKRRLVDVE